MCSIEIVNQYFDSGKEVFLLRVEEFCENFSRKRKLLFSLLSDAYITITSMPILARYRVKVERIILFVKIVNKRVVQDSKDAQHVASFSVLPPDA